MGVFFLQVPSPWPPFFVRCEIPIEYLSGYGSEEHQMAQGTAMPLRCKEGMLPRISRFQGCLGNVWRTSLRALARVQHVAAIKSSNCGE